MTDDEIIEQNKFSLFPFKLDQLPSENVLTQTQDPFDYKDLTIWHFEEGFAVSNTNHCKETKLAYELYETYPELIEAINHHFSTLENP